MIDRIVTFSLHNQYKQMLVFVSVYVCGFVYRLTFRHMINIIIYLSLNIIKSGLFSFSDYVFKMTRTVTESNIIKLSMYVYGCRTADVSKME